MLFHIFWNWSNERYQYYALISLLVRRKRCEGGGKVKPDDVISFLWYSDSSKRHFCILSLVLRSSSSYSSPGLFLFLAPFHPWTYNLQPLPLGRGARQPLLPFTVLLCLLAPPRFAFEYNTWLLSGSRAPLTEANCNYVDARPLLRPFWTSGWMPKLLLSHFGALSALAHSRRSRDYERNRNGCASARLHDASSRRSHPSDLMKFRDEVLMARRRHRGWLENSRARIYAVIKMHFI